MKKIIFLCFIWSVAIGKTIMTTGDISRDYEIIQVVFSLEKGKSKYDIEKALEELDNKAKEIGGDAVINIRIEMFAFNEGDYEAETLILAYGTVVKYRYDEKTKKK